VRKILLLIAERSSKFLWHGTERVIFLATKNTPEVKNKRASVEHASPCTIVRTRILAKQGGAASPLGHIAPENQAVSRPSPGQARPAMPRDPIIGRLFDSRAPALLLYPRSELFCLADPESDKTGQPFCPLSMARPSSTPTWRCSRTLTSRNRRNCISTSTAITS
jgi:hypothetical protein